jgi:hypothetical protein
MRTEPAKQIRNCKFLMFTGKKSAEAMHVKQLKNKSPTEYDKGDVKRERISLSNSFGTPKAMTINKRERSARQSVIMIFFLFKTSFLNITKKTAKDSHRPKGKSMIGLLIKSQNVQGIIWCKTRTLSEV